MHRFAKPATGQILGVDLARPGGDRTAVAVAPEVIRQFGGIEKTRTALGLGKGVLLFGLERAPVA